MKKVALVTGGSRGIGYGIVKQLALSGFDIAMNGVRHFDDVMGIVDEIKMLDVDVIYCRGNIAVATDREKIVQEIKNHFGQLNVLVNNAGIAPKQRNDILSTTEESYDEVMDTNLKGTYFLTQLAANYFIEQKNINANFNGCIINVSSISAIVASVNRGEYCISKAGIGMLTQLFAVRLGEYKIPVYEVRPGVIATDMTAGVKEKYDALIAQGLCIQNRWGQADDVGKAVTALADGFFPYSTGQIIMVDGGLTISRL